MNILTGPPLEKKDDARMVQDFMKQEGIKIVSGGITSQIVARELGRRLITSVGVLDPENCTTVNLFIGKAINKDYTTKELPFEISVRQNVIKRLQAVLAAMHRSVHVYYY